MNLEESLEKVLKAFEGYYTVKREKVSPPFSAEALFLQHEERYFLSRSIRLSESDARELVYFAAEEVLDGKKAAQLEETAWNKGIARVVPEWGNRGTDITLIILTKQLKEEARDVIRKANRSRGFALSLKGWSNYRLVAMELPSGTEVHNRLGRETAETLCNILLHTGSRKK